MFYHLYHKDIPVLAFETDEDEISEITEIFNESHLPVGVFRDYEAGVSQKQQFRAWWRGRAIPASRQNLRDALELLGNITTERLVMQSFALSLSDHYWAKPAASDVRWSDVNFFENDFSEDVGKALFGTLDVQDISSLSLVSPDNTSDGWLKKKWIINGGERVLLKGGSGPYQQEPFNEVLAAEICKRLGIPHVEYSVAQKEWDYFSACKDFVTVNTEFVPVSRIYKVKEYTGGLWDKYTHFKECCEIVGINFAALEKQLCGMFIVDYIMANSDRHFGNFGFVRNPDTLEWLGLAPVFDTGSSLFYKNPTAFLKDADKIHSNVLLARPFGYKQADQLALLPCARLCHDLPFDSLAGIENWFDTVLKQNERMDESRRPLLCEILRDRVKETGRLVRPL